MTDAALYLLLSTSIAMSALLTWSTRRVWTAVSNLSTMAARNAASAESLGAQANLLAAQAQANTAHNALLSGSIDTLRHDLDLKTAAYLEEKPEPKRWP
jgi:hypothetical protein